MLLLSRNIITNWLALYHTTSASEDRNDKNADYQDCQVRLFCDVRKENCLRTFHAVERQVILKSKKHLLPCEDVVHRYLIFLIKIEGTKSELAIIKLR